MKNMKKLVSLLLAVCLMASLAIGASAAEPTTVDVSGGTGTSKADREFALALRYGKCSTDFPYAQQRLFLQEKEKVQGARAYVYNDYCFIFDASSDRCITTYQLPKWFYRGCYYAGKKRIRNVRKYQRFNPSCGLVA